MAARVFNGMSRVFARTFREPGQHWWQRHDADEPDAIEVIFNAAHIEVSADGVTMTDAAPVAFVTRDALLAIAPGRVQLEPSLWVNNDDTLVINGKTYCVESCSFDGLAMVRIDLFRKRA